MIWRRKHRPFSVVELCILAAILVATLMIVRGCPPAQAEWVTIDKFKGLNTDANPSRLELGEARYAVGVYIRDGELVNGNYLRYVGQSYISDQPCHVLSRMSDKDGILFDNQWLQWYDAAGDSSYIMEDTTTTVTDSCTGIRYTGAAGWFGAPGDMLSRYAGDTSLAKFNLSPLSSLRLKPTAGGSDVVVPISAIYSEKYIRLADTGLITNGTKYFWKTFGTAIGKNNTAALQFTDTVLFFNGQQMTVLAKDEISKSTPTIVNAPPDTADVRYEIATGCDTSAYGELRIKGTAGQLRRADLKKYMYFQDTSLTYIGQIAMIQQFDTAGELGAGVALRVPVDTALRARILARYASANLRVQIFSKPLAEVIVPSYNHAFAAVDTSVTLVQTCSTYTPSAGITTRYRYQQYVNVTANTMFGPVYGPKLMADPRCDDNAFWEFERTNGYYAPPFSTKILTMRIIPIRRVGGSTTKLRVLITQDSTAGQSSTTRAGVFRDFAIRRWDPGFASTLDTLGVVSKTSHWTIVEPHRARAWYAGNKMTTPWDSSVIFAWSELDDYQTITGNLDRVEGDAPIVGLSSMGSNLLIYRQRPPNAILSVSGFDEADFYITPLSTGVSAVSDQSISRNPLDEADYFPNNHGLWRCDGGSVTKVNTRCESIFRDSINWASEEQIVGAVFDDHYWMAAPFGSSTVNDRFLTIDLKEGSGEVTFVPNYYTWYPGSLRVLRLPGFQDRMFAGASDTGNLFKIQPPGTFAFAGDVTDTYKMTGNAGEWRSGWMDFGDPSARKRINNYSIVYQGTSWLNYLGTNDSIIVNLYTDFSDTPAWSDRIGAGGATTATVSRTNAVGGVVQGHHLSFGIQFKGPSSGLAGDFTVTKFAMDVVPVGTVKPR